LEPEILIVDEVLAVGDAEFQKKCLGKMREVSGRDGRTVIFVSHALGSVQDLCDRTILIQSGEKVFDGNTRAAINRYLDVSTTRSLQKAATFFHRRSSSDVLHIFFGEELAIEFDAELPDGISAGINISFHDSDGRLISLYSTDPHDGVVLPRGSKRTITFKLVPCLLAPGRYTVDLALTEAGVRTLEEAPAAFVLEVAEKALGGRWPYRKEFGASYLPHIWRID
jgi:lipopolysaccharide transport system ATP-binding protein